MIMSDANEKSGYIFVSYCHEDEDYVKNIVTELTDNGFRVWYDNIIDPGDDWPEIIASKLMGCEVCIAFITTSFLASHNCKKEFNFAMMKQKPILVILEDKAELTPAMEMQLSTIQAIIAYKMDNGSFIHELLNAPLIAGCKNEQLIKNNDLVCRITCRRNGEKAELRSGSIKLGRSRSCDLSIIDNRAVGREHAIVSRSGNRFSIKDNNSMNGVFLNGLKITKSVTLHTGDTLVLGNECLDIEIIDEKK